MGWVQCPKCLIFHRQRKGNESAFQECRDCQRAEMAKGAEA